MDQRHTLGGSVAVTGLAENAVSATRAGRGPRGDRSEDRACELRRIRLGVWAEGGASGVLTPAQRSLQGAVPVTHLSVQPVQTPTGASGPQACRVLQPLLQRPVSMDLMSSWTPPGRGHPLPGAHDAHVPRGLRRGVPSARPVCTETPSRLQLASPQKETRGPLGPPLTPQRWEGAARAASGHAGRSSSPSRRDGEEVDSHAD